MLELFFFLPRIVRKNFKQKNTSNFLHSMEFYMFIPSIYIHAYAL